MPTPRTAFLTYLNSAVFPVLLAFVLPGGSGAARHGDALTTLIRARLTKLARTITKLLKSPTPPTPRKPAPATPPKLDFVPARVTVYSHGPDDPPLPENPPPPPEKPLRLPGHYRWLTKLYPEFLRDRHFLEDELRRQSVKDAIAADPRLAKAVRKLAWALGVERHLIPPTPKRPMKLLVPHSDIARAKAEYADGLKIMSFEQIMRKWVMFPDDPWMVKAREVSRDKRHNHDKRPVWLGPHLRMPEFQEVHYSFRE